MFLLAQNGASIDVMCKTMYILKFKEAELIGLEFTAGDAPMGCALATLGASQITQLLEQHIAEYGEETEEGMFELTLQDDYTVIDENGEKLNYTGGLVSWVRGLDEITIDIVGIPYPEYENKFPDLVSQYNEQFKST